MSDEEKRVGVAELEEYDEDTLEEEEAPHGPSGLSLALNRHFHQLDRGGSLGGELVAGLTMALLTVCVIFMNMQVVGNLINGTLALNNSPQDPKNIQAAMVFTKLYAGSVLVTVIGGVLIGIVANLPLVQLSTMGLFSSVLCLLGAENGLTYQNILFINLIAALCYGVVAGVPKLRDGLYRAIPTPVRKALPAASGLIVAYVALQLSGFITTNEIPFGLGGGQFLVAPSGVTFAGMRALELCALIGSAVAILLYILLRVFRIKRAALFSLLAGTAVFIGVAIVKNGIDTASSESIINFGRVWLVAGSQASRTTPFADSYLTYALTSIQQVFSSMGQVLTQGMDFSAYSGNTVALIVSAVGCYALSSLFHAEGTLLDTETAVNKSAEVPVEVDSEPRMRKALLCNAGINLVAPFLGVGGITLSKTGVAATKDGGKSGLSSIFAGVFTLLSLGVMVIPALFATMTYPVTSMNQWNYFAYGNGGIVYLIQGAVFSVVDVVMMGVGVSMAVSLAQLNWKSPRQWIPALLTVAISVITCNIVAGVGVGLVCFAVLSFLPVGEDKEPVNVPMLVLTALTAVVIALL